MEVKIINENKREFLDLLLLADEQESMMPFSGECYLLIVIPYYGGFFEKCCVIM